jgi:hypothetical protein
MNSKLKILSVWSRGKFGRGIMVKGMEKISSCFIPLTIIPLTSFPSFLLSLDSSIFAEIWQGNYWQGNGKDCFQFYSPDSHSLDLIRFFSSGSNHSLSFHA